MSQTKRWFETLDDLRVAILEGEPAATRRLTSLIHRVAKGSVETFPTIHDLRQALQDGRVDAIFIDLVAIGTDISVPFIEETRSTYPRIPICLFGTTESLSNIPGISPKWRKRFEHYLRAPIDVPDQSLQDSLGSILSNCAADIVRWEAKNQLAQVTSELKQGSGKLDSGTQQRVLATMEAAQAALSTPAVSVAPPSGFAVFFQDARVTALVNSTLEECSKTARRSSHVNVAVIAFGMAMILFSFTAFLVERDPLILSFGGFGLAGLIAALISSPLKRMANDASRLMQLQLAYLSFLNQTALLTDSADSSSRTERSRLLGEESRKLFDLLARPSAEDVERNGKAQ
ncbi:hypothetical protein [Myxococcus sp. SDU36]|uniref:hypothetical protein n=1 Tax=Myxococcus sp. SDU36 TaxID=2831967 RepID=UPI0025431547|nr:hypothetical protein [Myxococcus sp. SDU36]WIG98350.1 hypothetical protein KGD87_13720 [Myxococcus sp. SDU36]